MINGELPKLKIGTIEIEKPIIQGGMGVAISLSGLASAVANTGGLGVIPTIEIGLLEPDFNKNPRAANAKALRREIRKAKEMSNENIGINLMVASSDYLDLFNLSVDEGIKIVFIGAGLPLQTLPIEKIKNLGVNIVPIVSSARAARIIFQSWKRKYNYIPDGVVVEGPMAGGHLGFKKNKIDDPQFALEKILPEVISELEVFEREFDKKIPVIAAGGIYTGADIHKFLQMGAQGVQMATRFVATHECDASIEFKKAYLDCKKEDLVIINSPVGLPGRAINNNYLREVDLGVKKPFACPWKCIITCDYKTAPYCIALALINAQKGKLKHGFAFAGSNAYRIDKIISVKELINELTEEFEAAASSH